MNPIVWIKVRLRSARSAALFGEVVFLSAACLTLLVLAAIVVRVPFDRAYFHSALDFASMSEYYEDESVPQDSVVIPRYEAVFVLDKETFESLDEEGTLMLAGSPNVHAWSVSGQSEGLLAPVLTHGRLPDSEGVVLDEAVAKEVGAKIGDRVGILGSTDEDGYIACELEVQGISRVYIDFFSDQRGLALLPSQLCDGMVFNTAIEPLAFHSVSDAAPGAVSRVDVFFSKYLDDLVSGPVVVSVALLGVVIWSYAVSRVTRADRIRNALADNTLLRLGVPWWQLRTFALVSLGVVLVLSAVAAGLLGSRLVWWTLGLYMQSVLTATVVAFAVLIGVAVSLSVYWRSAAGVDFSVKE